MRKALCFVVLALTIAALPAMAEMKCPAMSGTGCGMECGKGCGMECGTKGTITSIDYEHLTLVLHSGSEDITVQATNQTRIMIQGNCHATFRDLKVRMKVCVQGARTGNTIQATKICESRNYAVSIE